MAMSFKRTLLSCAILSAFSIIALNAHADTPASTIQLLPPTASGGTGNCGTKTDALLTMNGDGQSTSQSAINCVTASKLDPSGNLTVGGLVSSNTLNTTTTATIGTSLSVTQGATVGGNLGVGTPTPAAGLDVTNTSLSNYYGRTVTGANGPEAVVGSFRGGTVEPDGYARERIVVDSASSNISPSLDLRADDPSGDSRAAHLAFIPPGWTDTHGDPNGWADGGFSIWMSRIGNVFNIDAQNGNIGIGTFPPQATLDVNGNTHIAGNVGIGTATPNSALHVNGDIRIPYNHSIIFGNTTNFVDGGAGEQIHNLSPNGTQGYGLAFMAGGIDKMFIKGAGGVGIGTTSPAGDLDIENSTGNAQLCLNGKCVTKLIGGSDAAFQSRLATQVQNDVNSSLNISCSPGYYLAGISNGTGNCQPLPQAPTTITLPSNCGAGQVLATDSNNNLTCVTQIPSGTTTFSNFTTDIGTINTICVGGVDPNPPYYNGYQYALTCGSRYCRSQGYGFGMLNEADSTGQYGVYNGDQPYTSTSTERVNVACGR